MKLSNEYMAGIADSDGSFSLTKRHLTRKNPNFHCCFQLSWKYSDKTEKLINLMKKEYGGSFCIITKKQNSFSKEIKVIKFYLQGSDLDEFLKNVGPHVILKSKQVRNILEARAIIKSRTSKVRSKIDRNKLEKRYQLHKTLNTKNNRRIK